jgi:putative transposase
VRKIKRSFHIDAWVILPEHMHCIWTLPKNDTDYSARWREIKKAVSKSMAIPILGTYHP